MKRSHQLKTFMLLSITLLGNMFLSCKSVDNNLSSNSTKKSAAYDSITKGVNVVTCGDGVPGPIKVDHSWEVILSIDEYKLRNETKKNGVLLAVREFKNSRLAALGHGGFLVQNVINNYDNKVLALNLIRWLDKNNSKKIIYREQWPNSKNGICAELESLGYKITYIDKDWAISDENLKNGGVLIYEHPSHTKNKVNDEKPLNDFISKYSGSVLFTGLGWAYSEYVDNNLDNYPLNIICRPYSLRFEDGYLIDKNYKGEALYFVKKDKK